MLNQPLRARGPAELPDLVEALGTRGFGPAMAAYADTEYGGHVCFAYRLDAGELTALAAGHVPEDTTNVLVPNTWRYTRGHEWERDACLARGLSQIDGRSDSARYHDQGGVESRRHWPWQIPTPFVEKMLLCRRTEDGTFVLDFSRWGDCGGFEAERIERAADCGRVLMNLTIAHWRMLATQRDPVGAFGSPDEIERCLARTTTLTRRERQVCALHLLGASGSMIGSELGIEAESAKSYRKRAYLRLGVSCERELLLKFLALRAAWPGRIAELDAPLDPWRMAFLLASRV